MNERLKELLNQYLTDSISLQDRMLLFNMLSDNSYKADLQQFIEEKINENALAGEENTLLRERSFDMLQKKMAALEEPFKAAPVIQLHRPLPRKKNWRHLAVAAAVLFTAGWGIYQYLSGPSPAMETTAFSTGEKDYIRHITLPDGSSVVLHAGSELVCSDGFEENGREVSLKGEAYFDIVKNEQQPFIIHTGRVRTIVLGTAFNIRAYPDRKEVVVSVTRGKVRVQDEKTVLAELEPDQQISYNVPEAQAVRETIKAETLVTEWTRQDMVFNDQSFEEVAVAVAKRYGVQVSFRDPELKRCEIVASFSGIETLENVLETLSAALSVRYTLTGNEVVFYGKGCGLEEKH